MEEAIERGYTDFIEEEGEKMEKFSNILNVEREWYKEKRYFIIDKENPLHYSIDNESIKELLSEMVADQSDFNDENEDLAEVVLAYDFTKVAEELNEKFKAFKYYEPLDIEVVF